MMRPAMIGIFRLGGLLRCTARLLLAIARERMTLARAACLRVLASRCHQISRSTFRLEQTMRFAQRIDDGLIRGMPRLRVGRAQYIRRVISRYDHASVMFDRMAHRS